MEHLASDKARVIDSVRVTASGCGEEDIGYGGSRESASVASLLPIRGVQNLWRICHLYILA